MFIVVRCGNCGEEYDSTVIEPVIDEEGLLICCPECEEELMQMDLETFLQKTGLEKV
ncbi:MAG: hypothetical protein GF375_03490 [Candidatus Omnitrophica bacterium]|nr:hypothetical protein [Candidatus Omnitrophota bacterium]